MAVIDIKNATVTFCDGRLATLTIGSSTAAVTYNDISKHRGTRTAIRVRHVNPGTNNAALAVTVSGTDITVNLATNGSAVATSTANQVKTAVDAYPAAAALVTTVSGGAGTAIAAAYASLATGARTVAIKVGEGNLTYSEKKTRQYIPDRGTLDGVRNADEEPMDVSLDIVWEFLIAETSSGTPTPREALLKIGEASSWASTNTDACSIYCIDVEIENDANCASSQDREFIMLEEFHWESLSQDLKAGTIKLSGKCNRTEAALYRIV